MEDERKKEGCTTQTFSTQLSSPKGRGQSTRTKMVLFLIPIAVVGYQIYDKKQKEKAIRQQGAREEEESSHPANLNLHHDVDDASEQSEEERNSGAKMKGSISNQKHSPSAGQGFHNLSEEDSAETSEDVEEDSRPEWIKGICKVFHNQNDPFAIRSNKEALTYEVMGNQGSNALPFPKIDYH